MRNSQSVAILIGFAVIALIGTAAIVLYGRGAPAPTSAAPAASPTPAPAQNAAAVIVPFDALVSGTQSKVGSRVNYLITSAKELGELWAMIDTSAKEPAVDFSKNDVIAVFAGQKPTAGYAISVSKIEDVSSVRKVFVDLTKPGSSCVLAQSVTAPYELVQVAKASLSLTHEDEVATTTCPS